MVRNFGFLKSLGKDDYDIFQVIENDKIKLTKHVFHKNSDAILLLKVVLVLLLLYFFTDLKFHAFVISINIFYYPTKIFLKYQVLVARSTDQSSRENFYDEAEEEENRNVQNILAAGGVFPVGMLKNN